VVTLSSHEIPTWNMPSTRPASISYRLRKATWHLWWLLNDYPYSQFQSIIPRASSKVHYTRFKIIGPRDRLAIKLHVRLSGTTAEPPLTQLSRFLKNSACSSIQLSKSSTSPARRFSLKQSSCHATRRYLTNASRHRSAQVTSFSREK
jgi:hypothetical protein